MKYQCALLAVKDIRRSVAFYQKWFDMEVDVDLGLNVGFKGGLSLQENYAWLANIPPESVMECSHNMELYFDTDEFSAFEARLKADPTIEWVHETKTYSWMQRVLRIYDPDHHILEIGESMVSIFRRLQDEGKDVPEIARMTEHPEEYVRLALEGKA